MLVDKAGVLALQGVIVITMMPLSNFDLSRVFIRTSLGGLLLAASTTAFVPSPVQAAPGGHLICRVYTYFSDKEETKQVGLFARCPGGTHTGRTTKWFTVETFTVGNRPDVGGGQTPGSLPCEFLAAGCGDLPVPR